MKSKILFAGLTAAGLLTAGVASAQVATTSTTTPVSGPDLAVSIGGSGIMLSALNSSQPIEVRGLPFAVSGAIGGTCQLNNAGVALGTIGSGNMVNFNNSVVVPAGSSVTLPITCTGSTPGTYNVTLVTSTIPAVVANTSTSITPRGVGGGNDNDTTAVGTITIGSSGTVTGTTGTGTTGGTTGGTTTGGVLGTSTGVPNVPNTGTGGEGALALAVIAAAGLVALAGLRMIRRA
jgi:hypothetical protein